MMLMLVSVTSEKHTDEEEKAKGGVSKVDIAKGAAGLLFTERFIAVR